MTPARPSSPPENDLTVVPLLLVVNLIVFAWGIVKGVSAFNPSVEMLLGFGANNGLLAVQEHQWWRAFTSMFVHVGLVHLGINMYSLWAVGAFGERVLGGRFFLALYVLSGLMGSFTSMVWNPKNVSAGASGALFGIFGVVLAYAFRGHGLLPEQAMQRLRSSILVTLAMNVALAFQNPRIDHAAHVGGLIAGVLGGLMATTSALRQPDRRPRLPALAIVLAMVTGTAVLLNVRVNADQHATSVSR